MSNLEEAFVMSTGPTRNLNISKKTSILKTNGLALVGGSEIDQFKREKEMKVRVSVCVAHSR